MKRTKFSEAQIAFVLKQAEDGTSVSEVCRKAAHSVTLPSFTVALSLKL
jgi:putative transposase